MSISVHDGVGQSGQPYCLSSENPRQFSFVYGVDPGINRPNSGSWRGEAVSGPICPYKVSKWAFWGVLGRLRHVPAHDFTASRRGDAVFC